MFTVTVAMLKGGTGKTTTAAHLAAAFSLRGPTLGIDADGQGSFLGWAEMADEGFPATVVAMPTRTIHKEIGRLGRPYKFGVIDTPNDPSRDQAVIASAIRAADVVVIPVAPSPVEFLRLQPTLQHVEDARVNRPELRAVALLTRVRSVTRSSSEARDALAELADQGLDVLDTWVPLREHIAQSVGDAIPADAYTAVADELLDRYATQEIPA